MKPSCNAKRRGITLIEVVVSLVLLATLVTAMVVAYSAHHRQALLATKRKAAAQAADELLTLWYSTNEPEVPREATGVLPGSMFVWRTETVHRNTIETLPVVVVRLQVLDRPHSHESKPLAQVDVILPFKERL